MSEKRSWDIAPSAKKPQAPTPRPTSQPSASRRFDDIRPMGKPTAAPKVVKVAPKAPPRVVITASVPTRREAVRKPAASTPRVPLKTKRKKARKRTLKIIGAAILVVFVIIEIVLWQSWFRIGTVQADGPSSEKIKEFVLKDLQGTRYFIVPRNSIFFIPQQDLRDHILAAFPDAESVSIQPAGLTTLGVKTTERASILWWCGMSHDTPGTTCYQTDAQGLVFAEVPLDQRYATDTTLSLYSTLENDATDPIGAKVAHAPQLPQLIQFVKAMKTLNANVVAISLRGDEVDLYTPAGTRITYVIGREQQAANLAASSFTTLNLNDGSLSYVDLRFDSKVFFKKKEK